MKKDMADYCHWCDAEIIRGSGYHNYQLGNRFCDDTCRTNYHNAKKKVKRQYENILHGIVELQRQLGKQGELGEQALEHLQHIRKFAEETSLDCFCRNCGQYRFTIPLAGDTCNFCQNDNWTFKPKKQNPKE